MPRSAISMRTRPSAVSRTPGPLTVPPDPNAVPPVGQTKIPGRRGKVFNFKRRECETQRFEWRDDIEERLLVLELNPTDIASDARLTISSALDTAREFLGENIRLGHASQQVRTSFGDRVLDDILELLRTNVCA